MQKNYSTKKLPRNMLNLPFLPFLLVALLSQSCIGTRSRNIREKPEQRPNEIITKARQYDLVEIRDLDPTIKVDLVYKTKNNIVKKRLYPKNMPCLLHIKTAEKVVKAQQILREHGVGLKILDAYRPPFSHTELWNTSRYNPYIQHPAFGWSLHCFGIALDVTLIDLATGKELKMPSEFDALGQRASSFYKGDDEEIEHNNLLLKESMVKAGLKPLFHEWWHFYDPEGSEDDPIFAKQLGLKLP